MHLYLSINTHIWWIIRLLRPVFQEDAARHVADIDDHGVGDDQAVQQQADGVLRAGRHAVSLHDRTYEPCGLLMKGSVCCSPIVGDDQRKRHIQLHLSYWR